MLKSYSLYNKIFESGIRNIKNLSIDWEKATIYFHVDLDGVTSAIAMKKYLESYGIKPVEFHTIQYGEKEYDLIKPEKDTLPVLVDMSSGKVEFKIHTDHHEGQTGVATTSTLFKKAKSNLSIISDEISATEIFPRTDVDAINMVDSASFVEKDISPEEVMTFQYKTDKEKTASENRFKLALVVNKLLLSFKNKPRFLEELVKRSEPNMISMYRNLLDLILEWNKNAWWKQKLSNNNNIDEIIYKLISYSKEYIEELRQHPTLKIKNGILMQYDAPKMYEPGKFDRYASFSLYPDVDFFIMVWTMGLIQVSKNPFKKKSEEIEEVHLGKIARNILDNFKDEFENMKISLLQMKEISEKSIKQKAERKFKPEINVSEKFGLRWQDLIAIFGEESINNPKNVSIELVEDIMKYKIINLSDKQKLVLDKLYINGWDIVSTLSGGHKGITNLSGFHYLSPNGVIQEGDKTNQMVRKIAREFFFRLNEIQENIKSK